MRTMMWLLVLVLVCSVALGLVKEKAVPYVPLLSAPDVESFTAKPEVISAGQTVTLEWKASGTPAIDIDFGPENQPRGSYEHHGNLPPVGTLQVKPKQDSIFVVGCQSVATLGCQPHIIRVRVKGSTIEPSVG